MAMFQRKARHYSQFFEHCWLLGRSPKPQPEEKPMDVKVLEELKTSLQELSVQLDDQKVKEAIASLPESIITPILEGLKSVLNIVKDSLTELEAKRDSVANLQEVLGTVNNLLAVSRGIAPDEKDTLESVKTIVNTLQDLPGLERLSEILTLIDQIVSKLEAL